MFDLLKQILWLTKETKANIKEKNAWTKYCRDRTPENNRLQNRGKKTIETIKKELDF